MTKENIALVGFMGSGKSVTAKHLSHRLNRSLVSTDALIERRENRKIVDIFRDNGEAYFRKVESQIVWDVSQKQRQVIDCGGGVVLSRNNIDCLRRSGVVIYLKASPDVIFRRVKNQTHRPILNVHDPERKIEELLSQRWPFYEKADHQIETDNKTIFQVVEDIIRILDDE